VQTERSTQDARIFIEGIPTGVKEKSSQVRVRATRTQKKRGGLNVENTTRCPRPTDLLEGGLHGVTNDDATVARRHTFCMCVCCNDN